MPRPVSDAFMGYLSNVPTALNHSRVSDVVTAPVDKGYIGYLGHQFDPYDRFLADYSIQIVTTPTTLPVNNSELPCSPTLSNAAGYKPDLAGEFDEALLAADKSTQNLLDPDYYLGTPLMPLDDNNPCPGQDNIENGSGSAKDAVDLSSVKKTMQIPTDPPAVMDINPNAVVDSKPISQNPSCTPLKSKRTIVAKAESVKAIRSLVTGIITNHQHYSIQDITDMDIKKFNNIIKRETDNWICLLAKDIRRRGRNKIAARKCRKRKSDEKTKSKTNNELLRDEKQSLKSQNEEISKELKQPNKVIKASQEKLVEIYGRTPYLKTL
ncbi:hypothetical protein [Endozoicomonas acroporae]|uniref:hypothetical protein n=1 Tax=Endozoicomonas acroporae TaxID=1701104 RepID=UPI003D7AE7A0